MVNINKSTIQQANAIADTLWNITKFWDLFSKETIGKQLMYAVDKLCNELVISLNSKKPNLSKVHYYYIETHSWLDKTIRRKLIDRQVYQKIYTSLKELEKGIGK